MASNPVLVIGASGLVGSAVVEEAQRRGLMVEGTYRKCERPRLTRWSGDADSLERLIDNLGPSAVVYAAGFTAVDACEENEPEAQRWNAELPTLAARCSVNVPFVYYSTEYVFDGTAGPYTEADPVQPISAYGRSKAVGEREVARAHPHALIVRTTVVYGPDPQGKSFVAQLRDRLGRGERMRVPADQISSPTYNRDLAATTLDLIERRREGVWHAAGPAVLSRDAFARQAAVAFGLDPRLIDAVSTADLHQRAARPLRAGLLVGRLFAEMGAQVMRSPEDGLAHFRGQALITR